jgi:hypothetical protein
MFILSLFLILLLGATSFQQNSPHSCWHLQKQNEEDHNDSLNVRGNNCHYMLHIATNQIFCYLVHLWLMF